MANITTVHLLSVPLEKDYSHTLYFANRIEQVAYFMAKKQKTYEDFSYQRKDNTIRVPEHMDTLLTMGCNYVMYQNKQYSDRLFYAFITDMEYINDGMTKITIQTDVIQTWLFDITINPTFVEREHATTDEPGDHTIDEGLETGDFIANQTAELNYGQNLSIVIGVSKIVIDGSAAAIGGTLYNGIYSGLLYYVFDHSKANDINDFIEMYDEAGVGEDIKCMFLAPDFLCMDAEDGTVHSGERLNGSAFPYTAVINKPWERERAWDKEIVYEFDNTIDGYTPRNKKLLCFPYRYLNVSNNAGTNVVYRFEKFYTETDGVKTMLQPAFGAHGVLTVGCSIRLFPLCYNGKTEESEDDGITLGKYPVLNWTSDAFTNWMTQNSVNVGMQVVSGLGQIVAGATMIAATGGAGLAAGGGSYFISGVTAIAGTLAQVHQQSFAPDQAKGNINSGDVTAARGKLSFIFQNMSVKAEYARVIDEFFDMFGYKCNRVKIPAKDHRAAYWYTKTIDANISGSIPQQDLQQIKDCYNRGITFWRQSAAFRDYSQDNAITT